MEQGIESRERILEIAKIHFLQHGYEGATLRSIARDAGVTTGALYHHFKGKEELFVQTCLQGYQILEKRFVMAATLTEGQSQEKRFVALFDAYMGFYAEYQGYYDLIDKLERQRDAINIPDEFYAELDRAVDGILRHADFIMPPSPNGKRASLYLMIAMAVGIVQYSRSGVFTRHHVAMGEMRELMAEVVKFLANR